MPIVSWLNIRIPTRVLLAKPLFRWCSLYKEPTCESSSLSLLKRACFVVCLLPPALKYGRKMYFYLDYSDHASIQGVLEGVQLVVRVPVVVDHEDWHL